VRPPPCSPDVVLAGGETPAASHGRVRSESAWKTLSSAAGRSSSMVIGAYCAVMTSNIGLTAGPIHAAKRLLWLACRIGISVALRPWGGVFYPRICRNVRSCTTLPRRQRRLRSMVVYSLQRPGQLCKLVRRCADHFIFTVKDSLYTHMRRYASRRTTGNFLPRASSILRDKARAHSLAFPSQLQI